MSARARIIIPDTGLIPDNGSIELAPQEQMPLEDVARRRAQEDDEQAAQRAKRDQEREAAISARESRERRINQHLATRPSGPTPGSVRLAEVINRARATNPDLPAVTPHQVHAALVDTVATGAQVYGTSADTTRISRRRDLAATILAGGRVRLQEFTGKGDLLEHITQHARAQALAADRALRARISVQHRQERRP
jgi:hypothetical protein